MESVRLPNNAELERWCRAKILAALDRWQDEEISRRLATEKRRTKRKTESAPASPGSVGFFVCRSVYFWLIADTSLQLERTTNWRPDLSIIAPGRWVARMPGTGTLRRSSTPARIKAIVGKSRVAATRLQRLSFVFGALAMIGCTFFRSPRQRIFDQSEWQIGWPPVSN